MKCETCGVEVDLPFRCNYCEHFYCPEHRLPENHACSETWRVKAIKSARAMAAPMQVGSETRSMLLPARNKSLRFSQIEIRHLVLGTALSVGVGISLMVPGGYSIPVLALGATLFCMGFILHELAHKYVAQAYGLWAEFRVNTMGVLLSAISIFSPFKFLAPGAVVISGFADNDRMGRTAIAGPIVNVIIAMGLLLTWPILGRTIIGPAIISGAAINAWLALFNLIPFWIFDGRKVFVWNRKYWTIIFGLAAALTVYSYVLGGL